VKKLYEEFKAFVLRGNILDLAVAVVLGAAFTAVVKAFTDGIIMPIIAAIFGKPSFGQLSFTINGSVFFYGHFLNALFSFVVIAAVVFYFVVKPVNRLLAARRGDPEATTKPCPECLSEIPLGAHRCAFCTTQLAA
jgi:large conductance mechanosensitive channel